MHKTLGQHRVWVVVMAHADPPDHLVGQAESRQLPHPVELGNRTGCGEEHRTDVLGTWLQEEPRRDDLAVVLMRLSILSGEITN